MRKLHLLGWLVGAGITAAANAAIEMGSAAVPRLPVDLSAGRIRLEKIGGYSTGLFEQGGAEIAAFSRQAKRLFFVNAQANAVQALDLSDPSHPKALFSVDFAAYGGGVNSVATWRDLVAAAVEAEDKQAPGKVVFFDLSGHVLAALPTGALPDMLTFTPDGNHLLVANEGEPHSYCTPGLADDPEGSVTIIAIPEDRSQLASATIRTADFHGVFPVLHPDVRIFGPHASPSQDLEPEYIAVADDSKTAYVTLQEANAIAVVDIPTGKVTALHALGTKDHSQRINQLDASDRDDAVRLATWPVEGLYQPDAIAFHLFDGRRYLVTANEGDTRDYECYSELERIGDLELDPERFPDAALLQRDGNLGRLRVSTAGADSDGDGDVDRLRSFGARSFSIWTSQGEQVYDSGRDFERILGRHDRAHFNADNVDNDSFDSRSDDKGPEPEALALGPIGDKVYAFIGLERQGGIFVYDVTDPLDVEFEAFANSRIFSGDAEAGTAGDLGPEGLLFIPASESPKGVDLLVAANEISGTIAVFRVVSTP
jgi:2',3'-cyclic-nucleotide 2'-phosphodiesterase / 3'-nucleotidase / 5'-nucleotidase